MTVKKRGTIGYTSDGLGLQVGAGFGLAAIVGAAGIGIYLAAVALNVNRFVVPVPPEGHWWTVPILVTLIVLVPRPARPGDQRARDALWWTGHLTAGAVLAGVLSDRLDLAHRRRSQAEADA